MAMHAVFIRHVVTDEAQFAVTQATHAWQVAAVLPPVPALVLPPVPALVLPPVPAPVLPPVPALVLPPVPALVLPPVPASPPPELSLPQPMSKQTITAITRDVVITGATIFAPVDPRKKARRARRRASSRPAVRAVSEFLGS